MPRICSRMCALISKKKECRAAYWFWSRLLGDSSTALDWDWDLVSPKEWVKPHRVPGHTSDLVAMLYVKAFAHLLSCFYDAFSGERNTGLSFESVMLTFITIHCGFLSLTIS